MQPIIYTQNLSKVFKVGDHEVHALSDININIYPGVLTMLRGRSGSGKTTLMNLLGALDRPTEGNIYFEGQEVAHLSEDDGDRLRRDKIGFVFQSVALISLMTAYENVELGLRIARFKGNRRTRAEESLTLVGLKDRMTHRPAELSGGEQQRVAIARAIAHRPTVVFADEPTAELDTHMSLQVMRLLQDLVHKEGLTVVMTTHDPNMMELADHVYSLADGVVVDEKWNIPWDGENATIPDAEEKLPEEAPLDEELPEEETVEAAEEAAPEREEKLSGQPRKKQRTPGVQQEKMSIADKLKAAVKQGRRDK